MRYTGLLLLMCLIGIWIVLDREIDLLKSHLELTMLGLGLSLLIIAKLFVANKRLAAAPATSNRRLDIDHVRLLVSFVLVALWIFLGRNVAVFRTNFALTLACAGLSAFCVVVIFFLVERPKLLRNRHPEN